MNFLKTCGYGFFKYGNPGYEQCQAGTWSWNNCWFWVFEKKKQNPRTVGFWYFKKLKEPPGFMKEPGVFLFSKKLRTMIICEDRVFDVLRTMVASKLSIWKFENHGYQPKNRPDT